MGDFMKCDFQYKTIAILVVGTLTISPCAVAGQEIAQSDCSSSNVKIFATIAGGLLGAYIGNQIGDGKAGSTVFGGLLGGLLGNYIGSEIDRRHCELEKIAKANGIEVKTDQVELKDNIASSSFDSQYQSPDTQANAPISTGNVDIVRLTGAGHFASGSAALTEESKTYFSQMAQQYSAEKASNEAINSLEEAAKKKGENLIAADKEKNRVQIKSIINQRPIVLVGHTDDTGSSLLNQQLSEERARVVADLFKSKGIPASRIYFRGAGDIDPVADNRTEEGRSANRRVEIIELESKEKLENFIALKKSNPDYLRAKDNSTNILADTNDSSPTDGNTTPNSKKTKQVAHATSHKISSPNVVEVTIPTSAQMDVITTKKSEVDVNSHDAMASKSPSGVDFGGEPTSGKIAPEISKSMGNAIKFEKSLTASLSSWFVKDAQAADEKVYNLPCTADAPRYGGKYLSLATGKAVGTAKTADYSPGLYQTSWVGVVNGNYVGVTPVGVLRANFQSASQPNLLVYANTDSPGANAKPTLKIPMQVNAYPGEKGLLYRMYSTGKNNLICADVVLPRHAPFVAPAGKLYSKHNGQVFESDYAPAMLATSK